MVALGLGLAAAACGWAGGEGEDGPVHIDGAVAADTPEATLAGLEILAAGGNAVDAAVAVSLVLGVTQPSESGLGGDAVMLVRRPDGEVVAIHGGGNDARGRPTALRVLHHAWSRYGSGNVAWEALVAPALRVATEGYPLGRFTHRHIVREYDRIVADSAAARLLLSPDNSIPPEASLRTNPDLAAVLEALALEGPAALLGGELGEGLSAALTQRGMTSSPGAAAGDSLPPAVEVPAVRMEHAGHTVWSAPAPYGGPALLAALTFLARVPAEWIRQPGWVRTGWLSEALSFAWEGSGRHPVERLAALPPMPVPSAAAAPGAGRVQPAALAPPATDPTAPAAGDTLGLTGADAGPVPPVFSVTGSATHYSVVDALGYAVAVTEALGAPFGSGLVGPLGFFLKDPAESAPASLAPAIVTEGGEARLALGSAGAARGLGATLQVLLHTLAFGATLQEAVHAPRMHLAPVADTSGGRRGRLFLEGVRWTDTLSVRWGAWDRWGDSVQVHAARRGFGMGERDLGPTVEGLDAWFGAVNVAGRVSVGWQAVGDPRRGGVGGVLRGGAPTLERSGDAAIDVPLPAPIAAAGGPAVPVDSASPGANFPPPAPDGG